MKPYQIRIARKIIKGKEYPLSSMQKMSNECVYWVRLGHEANCTLRRNTCYEMAKIYRRRYDWYINH